MQLQVIKRNPNAIIPSKAHESDIGYDLTAISEYKRLNNGVVLFDTGISVVPENGYYTEIIPRSSLSKTGWMLANSIGIIDPDYRGNLLIALIKINKDSNDLQLPFCKVQLVVRKSEASNIIIVSDNNTNNTQRGSGGFGSTG